MKERGEVGQSEELREPTNIQPQKKDFDALKRVIDGSEKNKEKSAIVITYFAEGKVKSERVESVYS